MSFNSPLDDKVGSPENIVDHLVQEDTESEAMNESEDSQPIGKEYLMRTLIVPEHFENIRTPVNISEDGIKPKFYFVPYTNYKQDLAI